ncbi:hypothetical protein MNBD_GAMMA13-944 [hydrothermal vent metagenome]|uniref:Uncharacterized protein n=1 Tax=hydrothermal vent metagenome TaxID=652676 RepID=A0A3B0YXH3_9ZZZZ
MIAYLPFKPGNERPVTQVPRAVIILLLVGLGLQVTWHALRPAPTAAASALASALPLEVLRIASLGDDVALSKFLNLWLQMYDNQPGISIPFQDLDYARVESWLQASLSLDPRGHYPLLAAVRLYGEIPDPEKQTQMLEFAYEKFMEAPNERWPWLAHAVVIARHRIKDFELALKYANALADNAIGSQVPHWAQQMSIFVLEDMGEAEAASILIGGLLDSGQITDPHEFSFLSDRLSVLTGQNQEIN